MAAAGDKAQYDIRAKRLLAQKDEPVAYKILNRSIFYVSRLIGALLSSSIQLNEKLETMKK